MRKTAKVEASQALQARVDVDVKLLAQLQRVKAALDGGSDAQVIDEGAKLVRLNASLNRSFEADQRGGATAPYPSYE
jgi:hypothetical protein